MKIVRKPQVYLVSRQTVNHADLDRFLSDHEITWNTDTEIGENTREGNKEPQVLDGWVTGF